MSTLYEAVKSKDLCTERWKPFSEHFGERGISFQDLIQSAGEGTNREKITQITMNLLQLLEGDAHNFNEGWERLESACYECNIFLSEKYRNNAMISDDDLALLTESVLVIKKVASYAAFLWKRIAASSGFFSKLDLPTRKIFIDLAKSSKIALAALEIVCDGLAIGEKIEGKGDYHHWAPGLTRSAENLALKNWLP